MGLCTSCDAGREAATAKVILQDGSLREYSCPVDASSVLHLHPDCFLCDSDEMEFNDVLTALHSDEELLPGQIYFALPLPFLKRRLQPHEMASLAVKASAALVNYNCCPTPNHNIVPSRYKSSAIPAAPRIRGLARRNKVFTANLDAIAE